MDCRQEAVCARVGFTCQPKAAYLGVWIQVVSQTRFVAPQRDATLSMITGLPANVSNGTVPPVIIVPERPWNGARPVEQRVRLPPARQREEPRRVAPPPQTSEGATRRRAAVRAGPRGDRLAARQKAMSRRERANIIQIDTIRCP